MGNPPFVRQISLDRQAFGVTENPVECDELSNFTFGKLGIGRVSPELKFSGQVIAIVGSVSIHGTDSRAVKEGIPLVAGVHRGDVQMKLGVFSIGIIRQPSIEMPFVHMTTVITEQPVVSPVRNHPTVIGGMSVARNRKDGEGC